jgi:putative peptide zinc metalloprotease protein
MSPSTDFLEQKIQDSIPAWPFLREELTLHPAGANPDGAPVWHISDPARNQFFRIGWLEFEILNHWSLASPERISETIRNSTTLSPSAEDVIRFLKFLETQQLVRQSKAYLGRSRSIWQWLLHHYLFIRIPLIRPARLLNWLVPHTGFFFSPWFAMLSLLAAATSLVLGVHHWDAVATHMAQAFSWQGTLSFLAALVFSKVLHETAHALVATRHGVRVGHMGIALVVMLPMAYTDTGESWKLAEPKHRLAIASAGVLAELALAAWCSLAWIFSPDGTIREALFFLATTAWIWTLAINASPFMRFDGYFVLVDWLDFPGLHERASAIARRQMRYWLVGIEDPQPELLPARYQVGLVCFAFATWAYRFSVFLGIALVVYHAFFKLLGIVLFAVEIWIFILRPVVHEIFQWRLRRTEISRNKKTLWTFSFVMFLLWVVIPWPTRIVAPGVLRSANEHILYAPYPARIQTFPGEEFRTLKQGELIIELASPRQFAEREKAVAMAEGYRRSAHGAMAIETDGPARQILAEQQRIRWSEEILAREAEMKRLRLVSKQSEETVLLDVDPSLAEGSWVNTSTPIATIVTKGRWQVEAMVAEQDISRIKLGASASIIVEGRTQVLDGQIVAIENARNLRLPHLLLASSHGGTITTLPGNSNQLRPVDSLFRVLVQGTDDNDRLAVRRVRVHFSGESRSLALLWIANALSVLIQQAGF